MNFSQNLAIALLVALVIMFLDIPFLTGEDWLAKIIILVVALVLMFKK